MNPAPGRYLKDGKPHVASVVPFATMLALEPSPPAWSFHSDVVLTIPKIPYWLFRQIVAWQRKIAKAHECESTTSLFLVPDEEYPGEMKWVAVCFHQENDAKSMTAKVTYCPDAKPDGYKVEENAELLAQVADLSDVHATLHNHVNWSAGQSGTDVEDEKKLPGPHITIGNLNQKRLDFHARLSTMVDGKHRFIPLRPSDIIGFPMPPGGISTEVLKALEEAWLTFESSDDEIPEEWNDRFQIKKKEPATIVSYNGHQGTNPMVPRSEGSTASGPRSAPDDTETLEDYLISQRDHLTPWPFGFLEAVDISTPAAFKKSCEGMNLVQIYALRAIMISLGPNKDYNDVLAELQARREKISAAAGGN